MDDYDPMEAFMALNERQKAADDEKWSLDTGGGRLSRKRGNEEFQLASASNPREQLLRGLQRPMEQESFGMRMLEKMGYKRGEGLGKDGNGIKEPVQVKLKYDKLGIGTVEADKKYREETEYERSIKALRQELYHNMKEQVYKQNLKERANRRNVVKDLRQAQQAIEMMDEENGRPRNKLLLGDEDDCDIDILTSHLGRMIEYLRTTYHYCIYCGCAYNDDEDMNANCPGWGRDDNSSVFYQTQPSTISNASNYCF